MKTQHEQNDGFALHEACLYFLLYPLPENQRKRSGQCCQGGIGRGKCSGSQAQQKNNGRSSVK